MHILTDSTVKVADKDFDHVKQAFADMFYPYHVDETARDELEALKQVTTQKNDGFQTYLFKFQYLVAQARAGDVMQVDRLTLRSRDLL